MELAPPIKDFNPRQSLSQLFGVNKAIYQQNFGLPGHNALDVIIRNDKWGFGEEIYAAHDGTVSVVMLDDFPLHTKGTGVYINSTDKSFTTIYWHLSSVTVTIGKVVKKGEVIGTMGNSGFVRPMPSESCPFCGTHLHFGVKRYDGQGVDYDGFIDPTPLLHQQGWKYNIRFPRDLSIGSTGDDVSWLQTLLKIEGFAKDYEPIGFFGNKTRRDVIELQKKVGLKPSFGYVGPLTRAYFNSQYSIYGG
jgi:hypothetical protein